VSRRLAQHRRQKMGGVRTLLEDTATGAASAQTAAVRFTHTLGEHRQEVGAAGGCRCPETDGHRNDTHGHVIGDKVLLKIAEVLRTHTKSDDIPARPGGDEFEILLPGKSLAEAAALAEQIRVSVARTLISRSDGSQYAGQVSLSIGLAIGQKNDTLESLRNRADAAMYKAKDAGRNRVSLASQRAPASLQPNLAPPEKHVR
jgi:diguanylate cyclase (GGDEF)-like protein